MKQSNYTPIEIENNEKDIIQIWQNGKTDSNVIQIERENVIKFCKELLFSANIESEIIVRKNEKSFFYP